MWVIDEDSAVDRPLAVICALECELAHLHATLGQRREEWHAGRCVWRTTMEDSPVILACCGIGMLSAAAVTEAVIGRYAPGAVLNYGCAGAHRADLLPGDLVIGSRTIAYDSVTMNPDGTEGNVRMYYQSAGVQHRVPHLSAAPHLVAVADHAAREWEGQYDAWPLTAGWPSAVPHRRPRVFVGAVASADRWKSMAHSVMYPWPKPVGLRPLAPAWCFQKPCSRARSSTTDRWDA